MKRKPIAGLGIDGELVGGWTMEDLRAFAIEDDLPPMADAALIAWYDHMDRQDVTPEDKVPFDGKP